MQFDQFVVLLLGQVGPARGRVDRGLQTRYSNGAVMEPAASRWLGRVANKLPARTWCDDAGEMGIRDVASALGYEGDWIELVFVLDLPLPEAKLNELERWAREKSGGYEAVTWMGLPPLEWREAYSLIHVLKELDYPPEAREAWTWTADLLEASLRGEGLRGYQPIITLVMDATGAPVATSRLSVREPPHTWAVQEVTAVLDTHRGHRLSALAKVGNLRRLGREFPQTRSLHAEVAVEDEATWAINDRFGFRASSW